MWMLLLNLGHAEPDAIVATLDQAAGTALSDLQILPGGVYAAFIEEGSAQLRLLDLETWEVKSFAPCDAPKGLAVWDDALADHVFVGCGDGSVAHLTVTDGVSVLEEDLALDAGPVQGLGVASSSDMLYVIVSGEDGAEAWGVDLETFALPTSGSTVGKEGVIQVVSGSGYVFVVHGGDEITKIDGSTGSPSLSNQSMSSRDFVYGAVPGSSSSLYLADEGGGVIEYQPAGGTQDLSIILDDDDGLYNTTAIAFDSEETWVALGDSGEVWILDYSGGISDTPSQVLDAGVHVDGLASDSGYLYVVGLDGTLQVATDLPWIDISTDNSASLVTGDSVTVGFSADTAGDWRITLGSLTGDELDSGEIEADGSDSGRFRIDDGFEEGTNRVYVQLGEGRTAVDLTVDNPPPSPTVSASIGNEKIIVEIDSADISDLASYQIYITTEAFVADDYDTGGPSAVEGLDSPLELVPESYTDDVSTTITDLTNGQTYYLAVRVVDEGGTEGPMSEVFALTPEETFGAAGIAGETGGCGHTPFGAAALGLAVAGAALLRRRRGLGGAVGLAGVLAAVLVSPSALAGDEAYNGWKSKTRTNELHLGPTTFYDSANAVSNTAWDSVYGDGRIYQLRLDGGYQLYRFLELNGGLGLVRKGGTQVTATGEASGDETKMLIFPLSAGATLRLDPTLHLKGRGAREERWIGMPVVPYVGAGLDWWLWNERLGSFDTTDTFDFDGMEFDGGGKGGWHWHAGADILLDWMDPRRASLAEARWGIEDSYLTIEYQRREMLGDTGLSFAGDQVTVGLKIDRR